MRTKALFFVLTLSLHFTPCFGAESHGESSFADPTEVFAFFVEKVKDKDFPGALELFAYKQQTRRYDLARAATRTRGIVFPRRMIIDRYGEYAAINEIYAKVKVIDSLSSLIGALLLQLEYGFLRDGGLRSDMDAELEKSLVELTGDMIDKLDPARLASLALVDMTLFSHPNPEEADEDATLNLVQGFDERRDYAVLYRLDDVYLAGGVAMVRYGDRWRIGYLYNPYEGYWPPAVVTTLEYYEEHKTDF